MVLSERQIFLIRQSWAALEGREAALADVFYLRLFTVAPYTRRLFPADMTRQHHKLVETLGAVVGSVEESDAFLGALGARHRDYGVTQADYAPMGDSLIWALETVLGGTLDWETRDAWRLAIDGISRRMIIAQAARAAE